MTNLYLTHKEGDTIKWKLTADKAIFPLGKKEVFLESLVLSINRSPAIYLTSGRGMYEIENKDVTLNDAVELTIKDTKFSTSTVKWNHESQLITTDDDIEFRGNNFLVEGTGLIASVEQEKIRITRNVKATYYR